MNHKDLKPIYLKNCLKGFDQIRNGVDTEEIRLKTFFYTARYIVANNAGGKSLRQELDLQLVMSDEQLLSGVSIQKFINYFPITKSYDGEKYECKDYFSTIEAVREKGEKLSELFDFFWDYDNFLIRQYLVCKICLMSNQYRNITGKGLMETWADDNGIKTYTKHIDDKGREFLIDKDTMKAVRVRKSRPRYLRIVR